MKLFAKIVTTIIHPITLTIPAVFIIVLKDVGNIYSAFFWTIISLFFSGIVSLFVLIGVKRGFFSDFDVSVRRQRIILYPFVIGIVLAFSLFVKFLDGPFSLILAGIIFLFALTILDFVNRKIKASVHVAAISALVVGFVYLYGGYFIFSLFLIPLVGWARVYQRRHTLKEVLVGFVCGSILSILGIFIVQLIV